jgi:hypothetical protein
VLPDLPPGRALWLGVHLVYLIGFQNRLVVLLRWTISFLTRGRGARLIAGGALSARGEDRAETELVEQDAA